MSRWDVPDHPVVVACERTGYPPGMEPKAYTCPICGEECETLYRVLSGAVVGCEKCVDALDARERRDLAD